VEKGAVLISGAAGGIGRATVDRFLAAGYVVAGIDIDPAVESLGETDYVGAVADVQDPARLEEAVDGLLHGRQLRHVVGLAGRVVPEEHGLMERGLPRAVAAFSQSVSLNLTGQFALMHLALPKLSAIEGDRSITFCSSVNALRGYGAPAYSAAKAGLIGMTHALATPLARTGIRVNVVAPGATRTPLLHEEVAQSGDSRGLERMAERIPLGRLAEPADIAEVIVSVADRMVHVTDQVIAVDGGQIPPAPPGQRRRRLRRWLHYRPFR